MEAAPLVLLASEQYALAANDYIIINTQLPHEPIILVSEHTALSGGSLTHPSRDTKAKKSTAALKVAKPLYKRRLSTPA
jgi:hypothetical protein